MIDTINYGKKRVEIRYEDILYVYGEVVSILGIQAASIDNNMFYWCITINEFYDNEIDVLLSVKKDKFILEVYQTNSTTRESYEIRLNNFYALLGFALSRKIEVRHTVSAQDNVYKVQYAQSKKIAHYDH